MTFDSEAIPPDGETLTVDRAIAHLGHEDPGRRYYAAWWLGRFRVRDSAAVEGLIAALEDEDDRTPDGGYPLRRNAARALGKLGDRRAVPVLIQSLTCTDSYVREAAARSLGDLGDTSCVPNLVDLLQRESSESTLGACLEALGALGVANVVSQVEPFLHHEIDRLRYSAARALYQLTGKQAYAEELIRALQDPKLQLRRSVLMDLGAIGYLDASEAIARTLAENSLKLIALKGILEHQLPTDEAADRLTPAAKRVMALMDSLL